MSNALNTAQPGMWRTAYADSTDAWQIASRHMAMLEQVARHPELAELLDEAMMALADGVAGGPFTAATDALRGARARHARRQDGRQDGRPGTGPQPSFTVALPVTAGNGAHGEPHAADGA
jgi:hypothetical protein